MQEFDVVIVGGGMVGALAACGLGDSGLRVAVVERDLPASFAANQPYDLRVSALNLASVHILQQLGAWNGISSRRLCQFKRLRVWEKSGDTTFDCRDMQRPELGFIVENRVIQLALLERLADFANVELLAPANITNIDYQPFAKTTLTMEDGNAICGKVLVAADGGNSKVRSAVNCRVHKWDYRQHAMVIGVKIAGGQQDITWQRFSATGPQAFLPLVDGYASLVWYLDEASVSRLKKLPDEQLIAEISASYPQELGQITAINARGSFPLQRLHAAQYALAGAALIGDAAHIINPLAGQGVNMGLADAACLAEVLLDATAAGQAIASKKVLKRYEEMRRHENLKMLLLTDTLYQVFSNDVPPLRFIRNLGLGLAQKLTPARKKLMRLAVGLDGKLPRLAQDG